MLSVYDSALGLCFTLGVNTMDFIGQCLRSVRTVSSNILCVVPSRTMIATDRLS